MRSLRLRRAARSAGQPLPVTLLDCRQDTAVDLYWTRHTVNSTPFATGKKSARYLEWRFAEYPLFREFSGLWGDHAGETVLDYGCGPGDDLTGLALYSGAAQLIGLDVSASALGLTAQRLALHGVGPDRVSLRQVGDGRPEIPLDDASVDYVNCGGVLHHTSLPEQLLTELRRVLRPDGRAFVMVYNSDSIWLHLYVAYEKMLHDEAYAGFALDEAFRRLTDGVECPISRHYSAGQMTALCEQAGFRVRYAGGYLSRHELQQLETHWARAIADERLGEPHREFLRSLSFDAAGRPMIGGFHAGIGGVYHLRPSAAR
jgi:ubiquinone/menaquinone biosynthesis C-methylase UbiE